MKMRSIRWNPVGGTGAHVRIGANLPARSFLRGRTGLLLALMTLSGLACNLTNRVFSGSAAPDPMSPQEVVQAVEAFDPSDLDAGLARLNQAALRGEAGSVLAIAPALEAGDPASRWAAVYVAALLAETSEDAAALEVALVDSEPSLRVVAAASLIGLGQKEAIPVLIESLDSRDELPYSDPPEPVSGLARLALEAYTGQSFDDSAGWFIWWESVEDGLTWDGERYVYE